MGVGTQMECRSSYEQIEKWKLKWEIISDSTARTRIVQGTWDTIKLVD